VESSEFGKDPGKTASDLTRQAKKKIRKAEARQNARRVNKKIEVLGITLSADRQGFTICKLRMNNFYADKY
jgi:hypothetical protein